MSGLSTYAVVLATTRALRGPANTATWAGRNVLMSPGRQLDKIETPTICIFGGAGHANPEGRELLNAGSMHLRFELFTPAAFTATNGQSSFAFNAAASPEALLDFLWRQCLRVLVFDQDPWAQLWRRLVFSVGHIGFDSELFETHDGGRLGARIVNLEAQVIGEPNFGAPPRGVWADLLAAMRTQADPETAALADFVEDAIAGPPGAPIWQLQAAALGVTADELTDLGLGPVEGLAVQPPDVDVVAAQAITLTDTDEAAATTLTAADPQPDGTPDLA